MSKITDVCRVGTSINLKKFARLGYGAVRKSINKFELLGNVLCLFF
jgi:hypothetical protein